jgi:hypothetical protein
VFTARYALSPYIKQIRFVFKGLKHIRRCKMYEVADHVIIHQEYVSSLYHLLYIPYVKFRTVGPKTCVMLSSSGFSSGP